MTRRSRRVKILATLGPASADPEVVEALFRAGADVFRINMSHASHDMMRERVATIRKLEEKVDRPIGILVDLQGPKLRVGLFANGAEELRKGDLFTLDDDPTPGDATRVRLPHPEILESLRVGHRLLIDDGKVQLRVRSHSTRHSECVVEVAGKISNKKGVSLPDTILPTSAMTEKDRADLHAALEENIDWIALSFVQRPEDVIEVKEIAGKRASVMAKIEKPQAITKLDEIIAVSDANHGGARRSRRRNADRTGAGPAKDHHPHGPQARQAGGRRDPDAGVDDHDAGADAGRGVGRRDRRVRGRRRRHAVGRKRLGAISPAKRWR